MSPFFFPRLRFSPRYSLLFTFHTLHPEGSRMTSKTCWLLAPSFHWAQERHETGGALPAPLDSIRERDPPLTQAACTTTWIKAKITPNSLLPRAERAASIFHHLPPMAPVQNLVLFFRKPCGSSSLLICLRRRQSLSSGRMQLRCYHCLARILKFFLAIGASNSFPPHSHLMSLSLEVSAQEPAGLQEGQATYQLAAETGGRL